jgi:hypothetical protein
MGWSCCCQTEGLVWGVVFEGGAEPVSRPPLQAVRVKMMIEATRSFEWLMEMIRFRVDRWLRLEELGRVGGLGYKLELGDWIEAKLAGGHAL